MEHKRVNFHTLGCKLNFSETSTIAREFDKGGFVRVAPDAATDIAVINSCSVTEHADKKCRNIIRKIHRRNPDAVIAVTGCYAQLKPNEIAAIDGVDIVLSNNDKGDIYKTGGRAVGRARRHRVELSRRGPDALLRCLFERRPHTCLLEGSGRLRLQVLVLHDTLCAWREPQHTDCRYSLSGARDSGRRTEGDRRHGCQYGRFRTFYGRGFHRAAARIGRSGGHRTIPDIEHRA